MQRIIACVSFAASSLLPCALGAAPPEAAEASGEPCAGPACGATLQFELELDGGTIHLIDARPDDDGARGRGSAVSRDGTRIVFASDRDLLRDGSNADGNMEIFFVDTTRGELRQVTTSVGGTGSVSPYVNAAGTRVVFASDRDLIGDGSNHEDEVQLFLYDALTGGLAQLTRVDGGLASYATGLDLALDDAGIRAVFASDRDLLGDGRNADENLEVFLLDTTSRALVQLTDTEGGEGCFAPTIDGAGTRVRWSSDRGEKAMRGGKKGAKTAAKQAKAAVKRAKR